VISLLKGAMDMTSQAVSITRQIDAMTEPEIDFVWDFIQTPQ